MSESDSADGPAPERYDRIGVGYAARRRADPRWQAQIAQALSGATTVLNVGAGTGNYEPPERSVIAVEPSQTMIEQRAPAAAPVVQAVAEDLPFADRRFEAAMALLTVHHWQDRPRGLAEMRRVSDRQVLSVFEPLIVHRFWLLDYFPEVTEMPAERQAPTPGFVAAHLDVVDVQVMSVPHDCTDGVAAAHWRRPQAYLRPEVQMAISSLALLPQNVRERGTHRLRSELETGRWHERWGYLLDESEADFGYRLVIAESH